MGLRHALVGGLAVGIWGVPRATQDVDLFAELPVAKRSGVRNELVRLDFDVPAMDEELESFGVFRSLYRPTNVFVDIFDAQNPLGEALLDRRLQIQAEGRLRWSAAVEDLVLLKVFSDRPRDFEDLTKLIAIGAAKMDMTYIERWTHALDESIGCDEVSERLQRAKAEAARRIPRKR